MEKLRLDDDLEAFKMALELVTTTQKYSKVFLVFTKEDCIEAALKTKSFRTGLENQGVTLDERDPNKSYLDWLTKKFISVVGGL